MFAAHQVQHADLKPVVVSTAPAPAPDLACVPPTDVANGAIVGTIVPEEERPIPVTEQIFAPRKKEMNKGFLMFSQDEGLTSESHLNCNSLGIRCSLYCIRYLWQESLYNFKCCFQCLKTSRKT